jgi:hypothetical protein
MPRQPALHERLGLGQGCLELGRESLAVLKSMGRHLEQAGGQGLLEVIQMPVAAGALSSPVAAAIP